MKNIFNQDFQDFISALNNHQVEYILVGGYSVILHGYNRTTGDMDIWVNKTRENYAKIKEAFFEFGMSTMGMNEDIFINNEFDVFTFGRPPVCIDLMTSVKGLDFKEANTQATDFAIEGLIIRLIHLKDLIKAKKAANRLKDLDDIDHLEN